MLEDISLFQEQGILDANLIPRLVQILTILVSAIQDQASSGQQQFDPAQTQYFATLYRQLVTIMGNLCVTDAPEAKRELLKFKVLDIVT